METNIFNDKIFEDNEFNINNEPIFCDCEECIKFLNFDIEKNNQIQIALERVKQHKILFCKTTLLNEANSIIRKNKLKNKFGFQNDNTTINIMEQNFPIKIIEELIKKSNGDNYEYKILIDEYLKTLDFEITNTKKNIDLYNYYIEKAEINYNFIGIVNIRFYNLEYIDDIINYSYLYNKDYKLKNILPTQNISNNSKINEKTLIYIGFPFNVIILNNNYKYEMFKINTCISKYKNGMFKYIRENINTYNGITNIFRAEEIISNTKHNIYKHFSTLIIFIKKSCLLTNINKLENQFLSGKDINKINKFICDLQNTIPEDI